ncbi:hypothetical protein HK105_206534 [Polyrhizophydium stewartii]|uniref:Uncharacterized protein n=1 Tax=Polyrhizophydium stewartii TaxID=2732419 RepID=A0ABR4N325_9FUNG
MQAREGHQRQRDGKFDIFENTPSIKSASIANIKKVLKFLAEGGLPVTAGMRKSEGCRFGELMRYYSRHVFRRMRFESYSAKQRLPVYVQDRIYATIARLRPAWVLKNPRKTKDGPPTSRILFVIGDGDFKHNSGGHVTMPTTTPLFDGLRRQGETVCWVKEHRTSKCCSKCGREMQQAVLHKQLPPTEDELKARAWSKQDRQIKRKAHLLVKLARKHIQPDNQQAIRLGIPLRLLPITQDEADMAIKFARSEATSKVSTRPEATLTAALQAAAQGDVLTSHRLCCVSC